MFKYKVQLFLFLFAVCAQLNAQVSEKLQYVAVIGSQSVDYGNNQPSETVNTAANAFDGNLNTYFASYARSYTWVGLDLGAKHIITKIAYCPRKDHKQRLLLGVFEGANKSDFSDAIPLNMITETPDENKMTEISVDCSRGFRYVRYVGPNDVRCNIAEIEFYGYAGNGNDAKLTQITNLPNIVIHTANAEEITSRERYIRGTVSIISNDGKTIYTDDLEIRGRGNASWGFPKKPYRMKLNNKANVLGLPAKERNWTLINNYGDKTLMRNLLAFDLSKRFGMAFTPAGTPVNVFLNGEFKGCYQLCDQVQVNPKRVEIETMKTTDTQLPELSGGYLVEIDHYATGEASWFRSSSREIPVTIKSPDSDDIVTAQKNYIREHFNKLESSVFASNYTDPTNGFRKYLDTETFIKHFLIGEISGNTDTYWSVYMYKQRNDDKFYTGPAWDFDLAYDNDDRTFPINTRLSNWIAVTNGSAANGMRGFVERLLSDSQFSNEIKSIYARYRDSGAISEKALLKVVDDYAEELEQSQKLNFVRWNIMNSRVHQNPRVHGSYAAEVENVRQYIRNRIAWVDKKLDYTTTSVKDEFMNDISVWTNNGVINIEGIIIPLKVEIINIDGKILFTKMVNEDNVNISFPKGFYIVRISDSKGQSRAVKCVI